MSSIRPDPMPAPAETQRDEDGRLVRMAFASPLPQSAEGDCWLIAVDGSSHARRATAEAARLACRMQGCVLHLIHVQHWLSKEAAETELARRGWEATAEARALLDEAGHAWRLHVVMGESAEQIVAVAERLGCRGIVVGSRGLGAAENLLIGSVAYEVIHRSPVSVLVVR